VDIESSHEVDVLVERIAEDLTAGLKVAVGFECPLFAPVRDDPVLLTSQRLGEEGRPWSAGAGVAVLGSGIAQSMYILRSLAARAGNAFRITSTLDVSEFQSGHGNLLLWEAFVAKSGKAKTHKGDAEAAARACLGRLTHGRGLSDIADEGPVFSIIGAVMLASGVSRDLRFLSLPCMVVKVNKPR